MDNKKRKCITALCIICILLIIGDSCINQREEVCKKRDTPVQ